MTLFLHKIVSLTLSLDGISQLSVLNGAEFTWFLSGLPLMMLFSNSAGNYEFQFTQHFLTRNGPMIIIIYCNVLNL